jgi:hypothetical protein
MVRSQDSTYKRTGVEMTGTAVEEDSEIRPFRVEVREEELAELGKGNHFGLAGAKPVHDRVASRVSVIALIFATNKFAEESEQRSARCLSRGVLNEYGRDRH